MKVAGTALVALACLALACLALVSATPATTWKVGVGLVVVDSDYDKVLKIAETRDLWDIKDLYDNGAFNGRYKGNQSFMAWIEGPSKTFHLDESGNPYLYWKFSLVYPDGKTYEAGPYGFTAGGFGTSSISLAGYAMGDWKIVFRVWNKKTNATEEAGTVKFSTVYGK